MRHLARIAKTALIHACTDEAIKDMEVANTLENRNGIAGLVHATISKVSDAKNKGGLTLLKDLSDVEMSAVQRTTKTTNNRILFRRDDLQSSYTEKKHVQYLTVFEPPTLGTIPKFEREPDLYFELVKVEISALYQLKWVDAYIKLVKEVSATSEEKIGQTVAQFKGVFRQNIIAKKKARLANGGRVSRGRKVKGQKRGHEHVTRLSGIRGAAGHYKNSLGSKTAKASLLKQLNNVGRTIQIEEVKARIPSLKKDITAGGKNSVEKVCDEIYEYCNLAQQCHVVTKPTMGLTPGLESITSSTRLPRKDHIANLLEEIQGFHHKHASDALSYQDSIDLGRSLFAQVAPERSNVGSFDLMMDLDKSFSFIGTGRRVNAHVGRGSLKQSLKPGTVLPAYYGKNRNLKFTNYYVSQGTNRSTPQQGMTRPMPGGSGAFLLSKTIETRYISREETSDKIAKINIAAGSDRWFGPNGESTEKRPTVIAAGEVGAAFFTDHSIREGGKIKTIKGVITPEEYRRLLKDEIDSSGHDFDASVPTEKNYGATGLTW